jgi:hypothetical protein
MQQQESSNIRVGAFAAKSAVKSDLMQAIPFRLQSVRAL